MTANFNIVTAIYNSTMDDVHGGRNYDFYIYEPVIYAMTKITSGKIVIFHDERNENDIKNFINKHNITNIVTKKLELNELPYSDSIFNLKKKILEDGSITLNNRLHIVCLSKLWFVEEAIKELKLKNSELVTWIDAGLFHHALFPESLGGVELARFNINNYWPINKESKFTPEFGLNIEKSLNSDKILSFGTEVISLEINWPPQVYKSVPTVYLVGGMFGGKVKNMKELSSRFYKFLDNLIENNVLSLEEAILSQLYTEDSSLFKISLFETWYHNVPGNPNYFEAVFEYNPNLVCFYRKFFDSLENDDFNDIPEKKGIPINNTTSVIGKKLKYGKYEDLPNIAIYGSHNASFAVEHNGKILEVVELERFLNVKNAGYAQYLYASCRPQLSKLITEYFKEKYGFEEYGYCLHQHCSTQEGDELVHYYSQFPAKEYVELFHHVSHAAGCFYQSSFKDAIVVSFDGGGNDGYFKIYRANREDGINLLEEHRIDLGFPYMVFAEYLDDIKKEQSLSIGNLVYAGKILGLQSYGKPNMDWLPAFKEFYLSGPTGVTYQELIDVLGESIGISFDVENRLTGDIAYQVAATSQAAFEELFFELVDEAITENADLPICLSGGCALNIVLNTKVKERYNRPVFVGPAPNDAGLAVGMLADLLKPTDGIDVTYGGVDVLDKNVLPELIEQYGAEPIDISELSKKLVDGHIVGVVRGRSEHGPRALGNRSILCNPSIPDMKDTLNAKVKNREWYRPFAPVVRLEDVGKYFNWEGESRWMSFCPTVKDEWKEKLSAITHIDGTARVQTVTREQNEWLYDLLTEFEKQSGIGVLLNTSFNIAGKPILSTYKDALWVFQTTKLDALYLNGYFFKK